MSIIEYENKVREWMDKEIEKGRKPKDLVGTYFIHNDVLCRIGRYAKGGFSLNYTYGVIRL